eukprot:scaffold443_cov125-Cylindrotheca_fusiformis.AAC.52
MVLDNVDKKTQQSPRVDLASSGEILSPKLPQVSAISIQVFNLSRSAAKLQGVRRRIQSRGSQER